jgi:branched-chain amino acid transport system ATP-binding protein
VKAIAIIFDEHRTLAAVLHGLLYLVREIKLHGAPPNFAVFDAMLHYVDSFQERYHHPKEDAYLFRYLRQRDPGAIPLIARLEAEHRDGAVRIKALEQALAHYRATGSAAFPAFAEAARAYASFHWDHMRTEEERLLPLARAHLTEADWQEIDAAFSGNSDPLFGASANEDIAALFRRIVNLAPPPIGVGPSTAEH